jgi:hypothetical protein
LIMKATREKPFRPVLGGIDSTGGPRPICSIRRMRGRPRPGAGAGVGGAQAHEADRREEGGGPGPLTVDGASWARRTGEAVDGRGASGWRMAARTSRANQPAHGWGSDQGSDGVASRSARAPDSNRGSLESPTNFGSPRGWPGDREHHAWRSGLICRHRPSGRPVRGLAAAADGLRAEAARDRACGRSPATAVSTSVRRTPCPRTSARKRVNRRRQEPGPKTHPTLAVTLLSRRGEPCQPPQTPLRVGPSRLKGDQDRQILVD